MTVPFCVNQERDSVILDALGASPELPVIFAVGPTRAQLQINHLRNRGSDELFSNVRTLRKYAKTSPTGKAKNGMTCSQLRRRLCAIAEYLRPQTQASKSSSVCGPRPCRRPIDPFEFGGGRYAIFP
jgi:hypothetical protein